MSQRKNTLKPLDAPAYRYWEAIYQSFYLRPLYVDVGKRWKGFGLLYLLMVISLFYLPLAVKMTLDFGTYFENQIVAPLQQLPLLYVQNGELTFDKPMPYEIKNEKGQVVAVIDTTGVVNQFDANHPDLSILFNKDQVSIRLPTPDWLISSFNVNTQQEPYVRQFDKNMNWVFDGKKMIEDQSIMALKYFAQCMIFLLVVGSVYLLFFILFPVMAMLGQVFSRTFFFFSLSYKTSCRLLVVSSTPMLLVLSGFLLTNAMPSAMGILLMGLLCVYYSLAISSLKKESQKVTRQ